MKTTDHRELERSDSDVSEESRLLSCNDRETLLFGSTRSDIAEAGQLRGAAGQVMMKKLFFPLLIFLSLFIILSAAQADEKILSFDSHITVHEDASMTVEETIRVRAEGTEIKRGIYRDFPTRYTDSSGNNYVVGFDLLNVLRDGKPEDYHTESLSNGERIYIGQKYRFLNPGEYTYTIRYRTTRQLGFFKDHDELYWNVTGTGWAFPMDEVTTAVALPDAARGMVMEVDGYTGPQGSQGKEFRSSVDAAGMVRFRTTRPLGPYEGLTIVVTWPKGVVREPSGREKLGYFVSDNGGLIVGFLGLAIILAYYLIVWRRVGKDPKGGTIIPLYTPPSGLSPAAARYIRRMGSDNKTFAAAVIDLAVKGALSIAESGKDYTLTKKKNVTSLSVEERTIMSRFFLLVDDSIELKQENHSKIRAAIEAFEKALKKGFEKVYFVVNRPYFIAGIILSALVTAGIVIAQLLSGSAEMIPFVLFFGIFVGGFSSVIVRAWRGGSKFVSLFMALIFLGIMTPFLIAIPFTAQDRWTGGIFLLIVFINILFYRLMKAPTASGRKVIDQLEGFRMFLSIAEKDRLNLLNPPERTPELFEKYLPYALALDVEQEWSEQFAGILEGAQYQPSWYSGRSWDVSRTTAFAGSLSSSFSSAIASSSTAPGSSSGSGGGGSSGGGGGGGGGGGW